MLNSAIVEVIIGMIFIFSLLSILVTQINTLITNILNTRAKHLKAGIRDMITDPVVQAKFMSHPLIRLIPSDERAMPNEQLSAQAADSVSEKEPHPVNWIPAPLFSQALLDIVSAEAERNLYKPLYDAVERALNGSDEARAREMVRRLQGSTITLEELRAYFETLPAPARQTLTLTLERLRKAQQGLAQDDANSKLIPLLEGIRHIEDPVFQKAMDTLLATAHSVEEAAAKLEFWFNTRMEQLSDTYKRNIQYLSLIVGLLLAFILNADSLHVARTLWDDPALRDTLAATARESLSSGTLGTEIDQTQQQRDTLVTPEQTEQVPSNADLAQEAQSTIDQLLSLRLPIGWELTAVQGGCFQAGVNSEVCDNGRNMWNLLPANNPGWLGLIVRKILGYLITMVAVAQGAPFWFDLLNRLARGGSRS
ncbi:MAG: hypothetical protein KC547_16140 [Anaerolineae bacterium]|nr:hypothetical protein [Anaerolineae bacterium]